MNQLTDVAAAYEVLRNTLTAWDDEDIRRQTPCRDYDVAALAEHLIDSVTRISAAAGIALPTAKTGLRDCVVHTGRVAVDGWQCRGIEGRVQFGRRAIPAADLLGVIALEFVVHAWDLAAATGYGLAVPDELANAVLLRARRTLTAESRRVAGFDAPVVVGVDANALGRLVAFTGRVPRQLLRSRRTCPTVA